MKWEYNDYRPEGFEGWTAVWGDYKLTVYQIGENRYSIGWYHKGLRDIKRVINANNWDEAKALAVKHLKNYFHQTTIYWQNMENRFNNWVDGE